jgi:hypothetical protein
MPARIADQLVGLSAAQIKAVLTLAVPKHPDRTREEQAAPPLAPPAAAAPTQPPTNGEDHSDCSS